MTITLAKQLTERLNKNMADFEAEIMGLDKNCVYLIAREIAAVEDTYRRLMDDYDFDDTEAEFLLQFQNPLLAIADEWVSYQNEQDADFCGMLLDFFDDDNLGRHPLMPDLDADSGDEADDELDEAIMGLLGAVISATNTLLEVMAEKHGIPLDDE